MVRALLLSEIQNELMHLAATNPILATRTRVDKIYEIFVLTCLLRALDNIGATFSVRDSTDNPTANLMFRLSPGHIYAPTTAPGFIYVKYRQNEYEVQNSLRVSGLSGVLHELDVCLLDRDEALRCRHNQIHPSHTKIRFLAECKFYGDTLPLHLGREFLGLSKEFNCRVKTVVANVDSEVVHRLVTKHKGTENFRVTPAKPENVERFVHWLANEIRQVL